MERRKLTIIIAGMPGSGKTTLARFIAKKYGLKYCAGSDFFKQAASRLGYSIKGAHWWDSREGLHFLKERQKDSRFDREVDRLLLEKARKGGVVMTSWTLPYLKAPGIKIWIAASQKTRAERISGRDKTSYKQALAAIRKRDKENRKLYKRLYGFTLGKDLRPFDIILETDRLSIKQTQAGISRRIKRFIESK
ncbi:MAG: cytidylate kinase family protein [Candidatus Aenigmarchaeota archaeon]|nr:cytidylate kinase family protein [Candidatus Aenigmarchaeota archaeon]